MNQTLWLAVASGLSLVVGGILQKIIDGLNKKKAEDYLIQERKKIAEDARQARIRLQEKVDELEERITLLMEENADLQKQAVHLEYSYRFCLSQFRLLKKHYPDLLASISEAEEEMEGINNDK